MQHKALENIGPKKKRLWKIHNSPLSQPCAHCMPIEEREKENEGRENLGSL